MELLSYLSIIIRIQFLFVYFVFCFDRLRKSVSLQRGAGCYQMLPSRSITEKYAEFLTSLKAISEDGGVRCPVHLRAMMSTRLRRSSVRLARPGAPPHRGHRRPSSPPGGGDTAHALTHCSPSHGYGVVPYEYITFAR